MQCGHEQDGVVGLELVFLFTLEFPVRIIDEDEDTGATVWWLVGGIVKQGSTQVSTQTSAAQPCSRHKGTPYLRILERACP